MPAGAVQKEAEELVKQRGHRKPLGALAEGAEEAVQVGKEVDGIQVPAEQGQPSPPGQGVGRDLDSIENR